MLINILVYEISNMSNVMSIADHIQHYKTMVMTGSTRVGDGIQASHTLRTYCAMLRH
jgi:hypothetical protein